MGQIAAFEMNKAAGFGHLKCFSEQRIAPCVHGKDAQQYCNVIGARKRFSAKVVSVHPTCPVTNCPHPDLCEECENLQPYLDYDLPIFMNIDEDTLCDLSSIIDKSAYALLYYDYFNAKAFGKLVVSRDCFIVERWKDNSAVGTDIIDRSSEYPSKFDSFNDKDMFDILNFACEFSKILEIYLLGGYELIFDFAICKEDNPECSKFGTNVLFYGLRSGYHKFLSSQEC